MKEEIRKIQDEELENVSGGDCHQTFSTDSYGELRISHTYRQAIGNHPLIVAADNSCERGDFELNLKSCKHCVYSTGTPFLGMTYYCGDRSEELGA